MSTPVPDASLFPDNGLPNGLKALVANPWVLLYWGALVVVTVLSCLFLNDKGPFVLALVLIFALAMPILLKHERKILLAWIVIYPLAYYEPIRLGSVIAGSQSVLPIFLLLSLPGAIASLVMRVRSQAQIWRVTFPIGCLILGMFLSFRHWPDMVHLAYLIRDMLSIFVVSYMVLVAWEWFKENPTQARTMIMHMILAIGFLNALFCIMEPVLHFGMVEAGGFMRPMGIFGFPIEASLISLISLNLALYLYFTSTDDHRLHLIYGALALTLIVGCLASLTKTNIAQLIPLLLIWGIFLPRTLKIRAVVSALIIGVIFFLWATLWDEGSLMDQIYSRFTRVDTLLIRQRAWEFVWSDMDMETLFLGKGWLRGSQWLGTMNYNYLLFPIDFQNKGGISAIHPHNAYIKYIYEIGMFGIAMLLWYLTAMILGFIGVLRRNPIRQRLAALTIGTISLVILVSSLTGMPMGDSYTLLFYTLIILLMAYEAHWISLPELPKLS